MRFIPAILALFVIVSLTRCKSADHEPEDVEVRTTVSMEIEEPPPPPPPRFSSKFKTVEEWLGVICDTETPTKAGLDYYFGLFESDSLYIVSMVGKKAYTENEQSSAVRIEFEPENRYFDLPKADFTGLTSEQVRGRLSDKLTAFTKSGKFQKSFFMQAASITTEWNAVEIWRNK